MVKRAHKSRKLIIPQFVLSNQLISQSLSDKQYADIVHKFISIIDDSESLTHFQKLLKNSRFNKCLNHNARKIEEFFLQPRYAPKSSLNSHINIIRSIIFEEKNQINLFLDIQKNFEKYILIGNFVDAQDCLNTYLEMLGESFWYISNSILLFSLQGEIDQREVFIKSCISRSGSPFVIDQINKYSMIHSDFEDALLPMKNHILRAHSEYHNADFLDGMAILGLMYIPGPLIAPSRFEHAIEKLAGYPLIDQYLLIVKASHHLLTKEDYFDITTKQSLQIFVNEISVFINDENLTALTSNVTDKKNSEAHNMLYQAYECGNYALVIDNYEKNLEQFTNPFSIINIVAKSHAYLQYEPEKLQNPINEIVKLFYKLHCSLGSQLLNEDGITSKIIKFYGFSKWAHLQSELYISLPHRYDSQDVILGFKLALNSGGDKNPLLFTAVEFDLNAKFENNINRFGSGLLSSEKSIPTYRTIKSQIINSIKNKEDADKIQDLFNSYKSLTPVSKDYIELFSEYCLIYSKIDTLISFVIDALIENTNLIFSFPLKLLVAIIEDQQITSLESVSILYYFDKYISTTKNYLLNEIFEDFLHSMHVDRPSKLLESKVNLNNLEINFFINICSLEVMDFLSCFDGSADLRLERITLLNMLSNHEAIESSFRMQEIENIISQHIVETAATKLNSGKISVDETVLIKNNIETIQSILENYRQSKPTFDKASSLFMDNIFSDDLLKLDVFDDKFERIEGSKFTLTIKLISTLKDSFINDDKYGLDKNLSTEIRHGFFSNLIRATLSNNHLLAEVNDKNEYSENTYWKEVNSFLSSHVWKEIDQHLKKFSKSINMLLLEVEEWMQIKSTLDHTNRIFEYPISIEMVNDVQALINQGLNASQIAVHVMDIFWDLTQKNLVKIQEKLNNDFRSRIDVIFEELTSEVNNTKKTAAMYELTQAITKAKSEILENIDMTTGWFVRAYSLSIENSQLDRLVEIALHAFKEVNPNDIHIEYRLPEEFRSIIVHSSAVKPFVLSIINLLDNCFRRSGLGVKTIVNLTGELITNKAIIKIVNNLAEDKISYLTNDYINQMQSNIDKNNSLVLMRTEGGSGLVKAINHMKFVSENSSIQIKRLNDEFSVDLTYAF